MRALLRRKRSESSPPSGMLCTKLVCRPAPTLIGGNGASCARIGVAAAMTRADARRTGVQCHAVEGREGLAVIRADLVSTINPFVTRAGRWRCPESQE